MNRAQSAISNLASDVPHGLRYAAAALSLTILALAPSAARADASGVSFWLPGLFGSLAAAPAQPGWALTTIYYHSSVEGGGGKSFIVGGSVVAGLQGRADLNVTGVTYTFASPVLGGQAAFSIFGTGGRIQASIDATLTGPLDNTISGHRTDVLTGLGDVLWQTTLKWNHGVDNYMIYATGNFRSAHMSQRASPISGSAIGRSTPAPATPISIRRPATNFRL